MVFDSFRDFGAQPDCKGELKRISQPIATELEITGFADRQMKSPGGGQPAYDKYNDGLAFPQDSQEEQYQIMTDKGPRVFMLFAQTEITNPSGKSGRKRI